jgi:hypothetical protein
MPRSEEEVLTILQDNEELIEMGAEETKNPDAYTIALMSGLLEGADIKEAVKLAVEISNEDDLLEGTE